MLILWGRATSTNVQKVMWACDELGLGYKRIDIGGPFGGNDDPAYRAKNPNGLIPTLEDGDFVLWESNAILRYLAAGDAEHRLLPVDLDRRGRANIDRWMDWQLVSLGLTLRTLVMLLLPRSEKPASESDIATAVQKAATLFWILDTHLATQQYVGGDRFTLADIAVGISTHRWFSLGVQRPVMPALETWYERINGRPGFQNVRALALR
jgi:glutathione S-transferase